MKDVKLKEIVPYSYEGCNDRGQDKMGGRARVAWGTGPRHQMWNIGENGFRFFTFLSFFLVFLSIYPLFSLLLQSCVLTPRGNPVRTFVLLLSYPYLWLNLLRSIGLFTGSFYSSSNPPPKSKPRTNKNPQQQRQQQKSTNLDFSKKKKWISQLQRRYSWQIGFTSSHFVFWFF